MSLSVGSSTRQREPAGDDSRGGAESGSAPDTGSFKPLGLGLGVLLLALFATFLGWRALHSQVQSKEQLRFDREVANIQKAIVGRLLFYEEKLQSARALFAVQPDITREQWHHWVRSQQIQARFPGIQGIGFSLRVPAAQREAHVAGVRAEGFPEYRIRPEGDRDEYHSIIYLEPFSDRNLRAFGYDMFSEPVRRAAMEKARDTGAPAVSGKVTLVQETDEDIQAGFLMYLPVYRPGVPVSTTEERRTALVGFVYSPFRMRDFMRGSLGDFPPQVAVRIFDGLTRTDEALMYEDERLDSSRTGKGPTRPTFELIAALPVRGHAWTLELQSLPAFDAANQSQILLALAGGGFISFLLAGIVWSLVRSRERVSNAYDQLRREVNGRMQVEAQLLQSQKMEAIGLLSGGVAHDFNNLLTVIQGNATLMEYHAGLTPAAERSLKEIMNAAKRAATLTRQLLTFSRQQVMELRTIDLNEVVREMTRLLSRILGEDMSTRLELSPGPLLIQGDTGMIEQVLMNLAVNARDAMPGGGMLVISTSSVVIDAATARRHSDARPGEFIRLSVSDTGEGIAPEHLPRIFEPFFTTKPAEKGTGLGLSTVYGVVQQHLGWIEVKSAVGRGTLFDVYFPRQHVSLLPESAPSPEPPPRGDETLLVVEDEANVRLTMGLALTGAGYHVLEAATAAAALDLWRQQGSSIKLVLTDMVMPDGMSGKELVEHLLRQDPQLRVIYTSGYSPELVGSRLPLKEGVNFLSKPFGLDHLVKTVRTRLDEPSAVSGSV